MQIDPRQPIIFDTDAAPGCGMGYWQVNPRSPTDWDDGLGGTGPSISTNTLVGRIAYRLVFAVVLGGITLGGLDMLLR